MWYAWTTTGIGKQWEVSVYKGMHYWVEILYFDAQLEGPIIRMPKVLVLCKRWSCKPGCMSYVGLRVRASLGNITNVQAHTLQYSHTWERLLH